MTRAEFLAVMIVVVVVLLALMWWGWRRRQRPYRGLDVSAGAPSGAEIARFSRVSYVSTVRAGAPMTRIPLPGLAYKGFAEVGVYEDGATIAVTGERPVHLAASRIVGSGIAGRRVGKAVEKDGLALIVWDSEFGELESSFRIVDAAEQLRFITAIDKISTGSSSISQEDAA